MMRSLGRDSNQNNAKIEPKPKRYLLLSGRLCGPRAPSQSACPVISGSCAFGALLWVWSPRRIVELMRVTPVLSHLDSSIIILKQWLSE